MAPLAPFNPPLGPNQRFCEPTEQTLQMREKVFSLTGDDFTVTTVAGIEVCRCKGKVLSISDSKSRLLTPAARDFPVLPPLLEMLCSVLIAAERSAYADADELH